LYIVHCTILETVNASVFRI